MPITLYDLAGADPALRFSPYCWRTRLALAHKGLAVEAVAWRMTEKDRIAFSGQGRVPVLVDGEKALCDSWAIADYLDEAYPDRASLFGGSAGRAHARFINGWADEILNPGIARLVLTDIASVLDAKDRAYFRQTREQRFGLPLEQVVAGREERVVTWRAQLAPVRNVLARQPWLGGAAPDYADYILLGSLQWPRCVSRFALLEEDDPVAEWQRRGLALFDGLLGKAKRV